MVNEEVTELGVLLESAISTALVVFTIITARHNTHSNLPGKYC